MARPDLLNEELELVPATALQRAALDGRDHTRAGLLYHNRYQYKAVLSPRQDFVEVADLLGRTLGDQIYWRLDSYYTEHGKHPDILYLADDEALARVRLTSVPAEIIHYSEINRFQREPREGRISRAAYARLQQDGEAPVFAAMKEARAERAREGHRKRRQRMERDAVYRLRMLAAQARQGNRKPRKEPEAVEEIEVVSAPEMSGLVALIPAPILASYQKVLEAFSEAAERRAVAGKLPEALEAYRADVAAVFLRDELIAFVRRNLDYDPTPDALEVHAEPGEFVLVFETGAKHAEAATRLERLGLLVEKIVQFTDDGGIVTVE